MTWRVILLRKVIRMDCAIIGGTGFYSILGRGYKEIKVKSRYGEAIVYEERKKGKGFFFLPRHGKGHHIPPHKINYRANMAALKILKVERVLATFAVGSINEKISPGTVVAIDQFIDFTSGRENTFFDGYQTGVVHTEMNEPYCNNLKGNLIVSAPSYLDNIIERGVYVCTNGPRFETPAEISMFAELGGDVVGMTGVPEVVLARELGIHYAAVAHSINWAAGIKDNIQIMEEGVNEKREAILRLFIDVLKQPFTNSCECKSASMITHAPKEDFYL